MTAPRRGLLRCSGSGRPCGARIGAVLAALLVAAVVQAASDDPFTGLEQNGSSSAIQVEVRRGDSLSLIARRYYTGHVEDLDAVARSLATRNGLKPGHVLHAGDRLTLPYPFADRERQYRAAKDVNLETLASSHYAYANRPEMWWPLVYQANRDVVTSGGRRVKKGTTLKLPPVPTDAAGQARLVADSYAALQRDFRKHLEEGNFDEATEDRFLLQQGFLPMLSRGLAGAPLAKQAAAEAEAIETVWEVYRAGRQADTAAAARPLEMAMGSYVNGLAEAAERLEKARARLARLPDAAELGRRIAAAEKKLHDAVRGTFGSWVRSIHSSSSAPDTVVQTAVRARQGRMRAFETGFWLSRLAKVSCLAQISADLQGDVGVARMSVPEPPPQLPALTKRAHKKDPTGKKSMTVAHPQFTRNWFPMALAYAGGLWTRFPEARNGWGRPIARAEVLQAILIHESRGVHKEAGSIVANRNSTESIDFGFAQINNLAHRGLSVRLADMARLMGGDWTVDKLASPAYLSVPRAARAKPVVLDLSNPAHNLVASVVVLSYSLNREYPATASQEERLVKALSAYNHGAGNPDYNKPWLDFVKAVEPLKGTEGEISAVDYGIGMKFYLGMVLDAAEVDWWMKRKKLSLEKVFYYYTDPYHAYAHFQ